MKLKLKEQIDRISLHSNGKSLSVRDEVQQFFSTGNGSKEEAQLLNNFSTIRGGPAQCFAVSNIDIIYYVVGPNILCVLFNRSSNLIQ